MKNERQAGANVDSSTAADINPSSTTIAKPHVVGCAKSELGLYDSRNGKSVKAYKIVDATELCTKAKRCVIKYADVVRGRIAQICDWYEPDYDLGMTVHYHINEVSPEWLANDEVFARHCRVMGVDALELSNFIYSNQ